jgi:hypothetical protein
MAFYTVAVAWEAILPDTGGTVPLQSIRYVKSFLVEAKNKQEAIDIAVNVAVSKNAIIVWTDAKKIMPNRILEMAKAVNNGH